MAPIERIYREMFDATEPGHESEQTIRVKDYYEYYPLIFDIDLPYYFLHHYESNTLPIEEDKAALVSHYRDYFRIPVLEDEYLHISVRKGPTNTIGSGSGSVEHGDSFFLYPYTANTDDAMYFLFDAHTRKDKLVDTSMIAGGFGIYCQPYEFDAETSANTIDPAELTTVYPLDPNIRPGILSYNEARKQLQLLAVEDGQIMLYFIDEETYTLLQKLSVGSLADDQGVWAHVFHDDYIVITTSDGRLAVIAADDSGAYSLQFCLTFETGSLIRQIKSSFADTAWNGEQLAMVAHDYEGENCNFYLLVFDATGVLYCGEYKSSLSTGNDEKYRYHVHPGNNDALTVEWIE